mgnify:CR=1 FL=1
MSKSYALDIMGQVQKMYDEIGDHFSRTRQKTYGNGESSNWPVTDKYLCKLQKGQSVLDIGCGNGKLVSGLPEGVEYIGTDFSKTLLGEAKNLYPGRDFRFGNVVDESHWNNLDKYDAVFCVAVLHHIPEKEQQIYVLKQVKKHLAKGGPASTRGDSSTRGGFLYLTVWNLWQEKFLQYHIDGHVEVPYNIKWKRFCVAFDVQSLTNLMTHLTHSLLTCDTVG